MIERALILSAGQGRRLLPHTSELPKCLLNLHGRPLIAWQVDCLAASGIREIVVVTGFHAEKVEVALKKYRPAGVRLLTVFNPFYEVADNIGSCFLARGLMLDGPFILLNGDTLFRPELFACAASQAKGPITVTVDKKCEFDADDMKVHEKCGQLLAIGKTLPASKANAESIGLLFFSARGGKVFAEGVERALRLQSGLKCWYLSVINALAREAEIGVADIHGHDWCEVDFPTDLPHATCLTGQMSYEHFSTHRTDSIVMQSGGPA